MLRNYLTTALRHLWRERGYAAVNVFGLAVGLAVCLVIGQFVSYQLSFDDFHAKGTRIHRVLRSPVADPGGVSAEQTAPLGPTLMAQMPEVEDAVRFAGGSWEIFMRAPGRDGAYERGLVYVDPSIFDVFSFELLVGVQQTVLERPYTMVITPSLSRRLFGETDPVGQMVSINESDDFEVTGMVAEPPANSTLQFTALASFATKYEEDPLMMVTVNDGWNMTAFPTFVQLTPGADAAQVAARISGVVEQATESQAPGGQVYQLQPLASVYLSTEASNDLGPGSDPRYVTLCATVAILILVIAAVNYVNLATARARRRAREIGVRKAVGANRHQLVRQLLGEAVLQAAAAMTLAVVLAEVTIPLFPYLAGIDVPDLRWTPSSSAAAAALAVSLGLVAGAYPAWLVSRLQPVAVARGGDGTRGAGLRKALVIVQFTIAAALMTLTLVVWNQLSYIQERRLGLEPEQVVLIDNRGLELEQARSLKAELLQDSRIASVSLAQRAPTGFAGKMGFRGGGDRRACTHDVLRRRRRVRRGAGDADGDGTCPDRRSS